MTLETLSRLTSAVRGNFYPDSATAPKVTENLEMLREEGIAKEGCYGLRPCEFLDATTGARADNRSGAVRDAKGNGVY